MNHTGLSSSSADITDLSSSSADITDTSITSYTISGLGGYGNGTISVSMTAFNVVGNTTSPVMNFAVGFASCTLQDTALFSNEALIMGASQGAFAVLISLVAVAMVVLCCRYKILSSRYRRELKNRLPNGLSQMAANSATDSHMDSTFSLQTNV